MNCYPVWNVLEKWDKGKQLHRRLFGKSTTYDESTGKISQGTNRLLSSQELFRILSIVTSRTLPYKPTFSFDLIQNERLKTLTEIITSVAVDPCFSPLSKELQVLRKNETKLQKTDNKKRMA
jgi:hypothetical protein